MSMIYNATTGLNAAQSALNVTSTNIANAGVPGYSRQVTHFTTSDVSGVYVSDVERVSDEYAVQQLWNSASQYGYATTNASHTGQLETTVAGENTSLSPALNDFFGTLSAASADPMDIAYRQEVLASSEDLAARFNSLSSSLSQQASDVDQQMQALVDEANGAIDEIAKINEAIAESGANGDVPNQLLDERDQAIQQLSEIVDIEVLIEDDQTATVTLPSGEPLVTRADTSELVLTPGYPDASQSVLAVDTGNAVKNVDDPGGAIGGLIDFRDDTLNPAMNELDRLALVVSDTINGQLSEGYDLNGDSGSPLFNDINSADAMQNRSTNIGGTNSVNLNVEISDSAALTADDYTFTMNDAGDLEIYRQPGSESVDYTTNADGSVTFEGITVSDGSPDGGGNAFAAMQPGDTYLIEPGKGASSGMDVVMDDPETLAFSSDPDEPGNNENLQAVINLQEEPLVDGMTINGAWNSIVSDVASASARAMNDYNASATLYQEASNQVLSNSGVNLDEEAANLLMFQQLYSANAQVISVADEMFSTILSIV